MKMIDKCDPTIRFGRGLPKHVNLDEFFKAEVENNDPRMADVRAELVNCELWREFLANGTEMILTKLGRRMFPDLKFKITGLDPNQYYFVLLDIVPADPFRYKYMGNCWIPAYKSDNPEHKKNLYCHPDSPALGSKWLSTRIGFTKLKLTNHVAATDSHIVLNSMHRYQPRLHIFMGSDIAQLDKRNFTTFVFPETSFMAVTAYQNEVVTNLKIKNNPFAKGFRDDDRRSVKRAAGTEPSSEPEGPLPQAPRRTSDSSSPEISRSSLSDPPALNQAWSDILPLHEVPIPRPSLPLTPSLPAAAYPFHHDPRLPSPFPSYFGHDLETVLGLRQYYPISPFFMSQNPHAPAPYQFWRPFHSQFPNHSA